MRLMADECVPGPVLTSLRQAGYDVISIIEMSPGVDDTVVLSAANERTTLLITSDRDFGELAFHRGLAITGVILLELERLSLAKQADRVLECLARGEKWFDGHFTVVEPTRVRRRPLAAHHQS